MPPNDVAEFVAAAERLIEAIAVDESRNGGLLSGETVHLADELRVLITRWRRR